MQVSRNTDAPWRDEELLREKYVGEGMSTRELRDLWGCSRKTISNWLSKFGIDTPSNPDNPPWQDKETLERLYIEEGLTCSEIGDRLGCSENTVDKWRKRHGVCRLYKRKNWLDEQFHEKNRTIGEIAERASTDRTTAAKWLDKLGVRTEDERPADYAEEKPWKDAGRLRELYHGEELSAKRVSNVLGCSPQTVRHWLIQFDIPRRPWYHRTGESKAQPQRPYPSISDSYEDSKSNVLVHRLVAYAHGKLTFGQLCNPNVVIHHRTNVPWDNRPENLEVMSRSDHMSLHAKADYWPEVV